MMSSNEASDTETNTIENRDCGTFNVMGDDAIVETEGTDYGGADEEFVLQQWMKRIHLS